MKRALNVTQLKTVLIISY